MCYKIKCFSAGRLKFLLLLMSFFFLSLSYAVLAHAASDHVEVKLANNPTTEKEYISSINQSMLRSDTPEKINNAINLAGVYLKQGDYAKALNVLDWLKPDIKKIFQAEVIAKYYGDYARALRYFNRYQQAINALNVGLKRIEKSGVTLLEAALLNDLGGVYISSELYNDAVDTLSSAYQLAKVAGDKKLISTVAVNLANALLQSNKPSELELYLRIAESESQSLVDDRDKASHYLSLGRLYKKSQHTFNLSQQWRVDAFRLFSLAKAIAEKINDKRLLSYAYGYIGQLYEDELRYEEALRYTRKAMFFAQEVRAIDGLYRWEWQSARIMRSQGETSSAIVFYKQAINTLASIRADLTRGSKNTFQQLVGEIYYEYTDLLLRQSDSVKSEDELQNILADVKNTVEQLKAAEIEDYFDNECLLQNAQIDLKNINHNSAVIYPVLLQDRLEIIVNIDGTFYRKTTKVPSKKIILEAKKLRASIESYSQNDAYLEHSQNIYQWLVKPVESILREHKIRTLVFVPDGILRSIPMSVLHDGQQFLIQKYAVAITPGLNMTESADFNRQSLSVFAAGISESVQGFSALPGVSAEISNIENQVKSTAFLNDEFVLSSVSKEMQQGEFSVLHIATHGEFNRDHNKSFLLTYDKKLTLPMLEGLINKRKNNKSPIELLVLSACQTAKGDERAALGLAGVAIRAGAKSALATLWYISDAATSKLISDFYSQLKNSRLTKSEALQISQVKLIESNQFHHPVYWAPFLLIGNWL